MTKKESYDMIKDPVFREMMESIQREKALFTGTSKKPFLSRWMRQIHVKTLTEAKELRERSLATDPLWEERMLQEFLIILEKERWSRDRVERMFNTVHTVYSHGMKMHLTDSLPPRFRARALVA
jgi:hypothetical protein